MADPSRRRVVHDLLHDEDGAERTCVSFGLEVSKYRRTHRFRVLREAGVVRQVDHGNFSGVSLRREDLDRAFPGLLEVIGRDG